VIERQNGERRRMSLVSGDMLCRQQNDELLLEMYKGSLFYALPYVLQFSWGGDSL